MLFAFTDDVTKEAVKSAIDVNYWTVTLPSMIVAFLIGMGSVAMTAIAVYNKIATAIRDLKKDVKENMEAQNSILPAVTVKVDSATKAIEEANDKAKKLVVTAAETVGNAIGNRLEKKADEAADKAAIKAEEVAARVADATAVAHESMVTQVEKIGNAIKGPDGTCLTAKVDEHGEILDDLNKRMENVEKAVAEGFVTVMNKLDSLK